MGVSNYSASRAERMSAIELAIRAESKKFLSSPLVVQVLENIWSGKIVSSHSMTELIAAGFL